MVRLWVIGGALLLVSGIVWSLGGAQAQSEADDLRVTVEALATQVADLEATTEEQAERIAWLAIQTGHPRAAWFHPNVVDPPSWRQQLDESDGVVQVEQGPPPMPHPSGFQMACVIYDNPKPPAQRTIYDGYLFQCIQ